MSAAAKYEVSSSGELLEGFEAPPVIEAFSTLFSVSPEKAASFVGTKRVVRKDLTLQEATVYQKHLMSIGVEVVLKDTSTGQIITAANDPVNNDAAETFGLVPNDEIPGATNAAINDQILSCPKCELRQDKSEQCIGCGIFFSKVETTPSTSTDQPTKKAVAKTERVSESSEFSLGQLIGPVIAAVIGAGVWHLIASMFGYEFGFVAWGIGGAVGTAAAMSGSSGNVSGVACAILVVMTIIGGKFSFYSSFENDLLTTLQAATTDADLQPTYDEMRYDAAGLADTPYDDASLRTYMVNHAFSDLDSASAITDEELEDFKLYFQPDLETFHRTQPTFDEWKHDYKNQMYSDFGEFSTLSMVLESLGIMDLIFLLLGVSTAFQIGRAGKS